MPKATTLGRHNWMAEAISATQPNAPRTNIKIAASRAVQIKLASPASHAMPMAEF